METNQPKGAVLRRIATLEHTQPSLERRYTLMGEPLLFQSNDPHLVTAADEAFGRFPAPADATTNPLVIRLFIDRSGREAGQGESGLRPKPVYRAQAHYFSFTVGESNSAIVDLQRGFGYGFVTPEVARDRAYVRVTFIEAMGLAMLSLARRYSYIHAACVIKDGTSILLQGKNGMGKSTLVYACARRGYQVLAEDVVFVKINPESSRLWGMPWKIFLLPDTRRFFPELADQQANLQMNGEMKVEIDLEAWWPGSTVVSADPGLAVLLKRGEGGETRIQPVTYEQALAEAEVLWPWASGWNDEMEYGTQRLYRNGAYRMTINGLPDAAVDALDRLVAEARPGKNPK